MSDEKELLLEGGGAGAEGLASGPTRRELAHYYFDNFMVRPSGIIPEPN